MIITLSYQLLIADLQGQKYARAALQRRLSWLRFACPVTLASVQQSFKVRLVSHSLLSRNNTASSLLRARYPIVNFEPSVELWLPFVQMSAQARR